MPPRLIRAALAGLLIAAATAGASHAEAPVAIDSIAANTRVTGPVARTRLTYVFSNPGAEAAEAVIELELPRGAALLRLAMDTRPGQIMDGEIATPEQARAVYDTIVSKALDPALLEHIEGGGGDRWRLSAFPIPARGKKTVLLVLDHWVDERGGRARLRLPMPVREGAVVRPREVRATVREGDRLRARVARRGSAEPIDVSWPMRGGASVLTHRLGDRTFVAAAIEARTPSPRPRHLVAVVDTSASVSDAAFARGLAVVSDLASRASGVDVVFGSTRPAACAGSAALGCVARAPRGGATNLEALLAEGLARLPARRPSALVVVSDGVPSIGERSPGRLAATVKAALVRRDVALIAVDLERGDGDDHAHLDVLGATAAAVHGRVIDPSIDAARDAFESPAITGITATSAGADWAVPASVRAGEPIRAVGSLSSVRLGDDAIDVDVRGWQGGHERRWRIRAGVEAVASGSAHSLWARAQLERLERAGAGADRLAAFSRTHGVAGPGTSMLVLESEADYRRWAIGATPDAVRARFARPVVPTIHMCGGVHRTGDLDKRMIGRAIRRRRRAIRHCYNKALMKRPALSGTVVARFWIDGAGRVHGAHVASSDLGDAGLESCVREQVARSRFPAVRGGGRVVVSYPFRFRPPRPSAAAQARQRRERIREIEAGRADLRRPALIGELAALYLSEGEDARAEALVASVIARHRRAGRPVTELLAVLSTPALRRRFGPVFRRAARARLRLPASPANLDRELFESLLAGAPGEIVAEYGSGRRLDPAMLLERLVDGRRADLAVALVDRWLAAGVYQLADLHAALAQDGPAKVMPGRRFDAALARASSGGEAAVDDLVAASRTPGHRAKVAAVIANRCADAGDDAERCTEWLLPLADHAPARRWLEARLVAIERQQKATPDLWPAHEAMAIHQRFGRRARSLAIAEAQLEDDPEDPEARAAHDALRRGTPVSLDW